MFTKINSDDTEQVMVKSDHNFNVAKVPLMVLDKEVPDKMAIIRTDTEQYLGTVGRDYKPVQPLAFYDLANEFMTETGAVVDKTITMNHGSVIGISFRLDTTEYIPGDPIDMNFLMMTSFNMQYTVLGKALSNRLSCLNQLAASLALFNLKHTTNVNDRLAIAVNMIKYFNLEQENFKHRMQSLAHYQIQDAVAIKWFDGLFPRLTPKVNSGRSQTLRDNRVISFKRLLENGRGTDISGVRGTAYGALNALTEYINHERSTRVKANKDPLQVKFESTLFGSGASLMDKGFNSIVEMVKSETSDKYVVA